MRQKINFLSKATLNLLNFPNILKKYNENINKGFCKNLYMYKLIKVNEGCLYK